MTASRVDTLRALIEAMTARPWVDNGNGMIIAPEDDGDAMLVDGYVCDTPRTMSADADGIVALRNCAPELLAVVEAARAQADALHAYTFGTGTGAAYALASAQMRDALDALDARIAALPDGGERG